MRVDIFTSIKGKLVYIYVYYLALSLILSILHCPKKSDWNSAYERREMKVLINVWKCIFKSSQWVGQSYIPWELIPFCNRPCIEGILVVIPNLSTNGQRIVVWHLREGLACILFYAAYLDMLWVESISITLFLRSKRFRTHRSLYRTQRCAMLKTILSREAKQQLLKTRLWSLLW